MHKQLVHIVALVLCFSCLASLAKGQGTTCPQIQGLTLFLNRSETIAGQLPGQEAGTEFANASIIQPPTLGTIQINSTNGTFEYTALANGTDTVVFSLSNINNTNTSDSTSCNFTITFEVLENFDNLILNFVLGAENLQHEILSSGLSRFTDQDFANASFPFTTRQLLQGIDLNLQQQMANVSELIRQDNGTFLNLTSFFGNGTLPENATIAEFVIGFYSNKIFALELHIDAVETLTADYLSDSITRLVALEGYYLGATESLLVLWLGSQQQQQTSSGVERINLNNMASQYHFHLHSKDDISGSRWRQILRDAKLSSH